MSMSILGLNCLFWLLPQVVNLLIIEVSMSILSSNPSCLSNVTTFLLLYPSLMFINGVEDHLPANCLSIFSFIRILLAIYTTNLKSSMGKSTLYNLNGSVFFKTFNI